MPSLVTLEIKEPEWRRADDDVFVGKDILELLSTSMYVEPLTLYREYVQNSADSIEADASVRSTAADWEYDVEIRIDRQARSIRIVDRGLGIEASEFVRKLTSIGGSAKRGTRARGFRGVGRLSGLAFCQELIFRTRRRGSDKIHELRWDTRKIRSLLRAAEKQLSLASIVAECVDIRSVSALSSDLPHFFEVELRNVVRHRDDRLLDPSVVSNYLAQVAPVPFHPDFKHGVRITAFLAEAGVNLTSVSICIDGERVIYRPHRDAISLGNGKTLQVKSLETFVVHDREGVVAAASWMLHHEYLGALPRTSLVAGWRLRSGNLQIGEESLLEDLFPESRFNSWTIAETHVVDKRIVPNGRRDNYEHSAYYTDLLTRLRPYARDIANLCRTSSISRNTYLRAVVELGRLEEDLAVASKPRTPSFVVAAFRTGLEKSLPILERLTGKTLFDTEEGQALRTRVDKLRAKGQQLSTSSQRTEALDDFTPKERQVLRQVIEAIHVIEGATSHADQLVGRILGRLRRQRAKRTKRLR